MKSRKILGTIAVTYWSVQKRRSKWTLFCRCRYLKETHISKSAYEVKGHCVLGCADWPGGGGGVLPYSLGGDVSLCSRKYYPLLDQILQILWLYTRLNMLNCSCFQSFVSDPVKRDLILDQFCMITRPYTRLNGLKPYPFQRHIPV